MSRSIRFSGAGRDFASWKREEWHAPPTPHSEQARQRRLQAIVSIR